MLTRRIFLRRAAATGVAASTFSILHSAGAMQADPRPNILLCVADDWSYPHASVHGDPAISTPNLDKLARDGIVFTRSFCAAPTCTASRGAILTGRPPHALESAANLWSILPPSFAPYTDMLEKAGYVVGSQGKGWGPGQVAGRAANPAGKSFKNLAQFLGGVKGNQPFCYWFGSMDPHRPYAAELTRQSHIDPGDIDVPPYLPDTQTTREDMADYMAEAQRFDKDLGDVLDQLERAGRANNTLVVATSDNGLPFPRAKANCYDSGTHMPLAIRWPARLKDPGRDCSALVSHVDFAPTFLEVAGLRPTPEMAGTSLTDIIVENRPGARTAVFSERERHADVRADHTGYPIRAIRTEKHLYIRNFAPERWPAGEAEVSRIQGAFGDIDAGPTKAQMLKDRAEPAMARFFEMACARRPAEELFDVEEDPHQLKNIAADPAQVQTKAQLASALQAWMKKTGDPRAADAGTTVFDAYPYVGKVDAGK